MRSRLILLIIASLFFCAPSVFSQEGSNLNVSSYSRPSESLAYPEKMPVLVLRGDWRAMGVKYGHDEAPYIVENYKAIYSQWEKKPFGIDYLRTCLALFRAQIEALSPELSEFINGVALGAREELDRCGQGKRLTCYEKILLLNVSSEMLDYDFWHEEVMRDDSAGGRELKSVKSSPSKRGTFPHPYWGGTCWAVLAPGTFSNDILLGYTRDCDYYPFLYQVALCVIPDDSDALRYMTTVPAGWIGTDFAVNRMQLGVGHTRVGGGSHLKNWSREVDFGVPSIILNTYVAAFCRNVNKAYEILTLGSSSYRKKTGRLTMLQAAGTSYLLVSPDKALIVERTAHHYYSRGPQKGANFLVISNDFCCGDSFNDEGMRTLIPMSHFGAAAGDAEADSGVLRRESLARMISGFKGKITIEEARNNAGSLSSFIDESGKGREMLLRSGKSVNARQTGASIINQASESGKPFYGTISSHLVVLPALSMEFVLGPTWDWSGAWQRLRLYEGQ